MLFLLVFAHIRPTMSPMIVGTSHPSPRPKKGRNLIPNADTLSIKLAGIKLFFGNEVIKSNIAAINAKKLVVANTFLSKLNALPKSASKMILIVNGYKNISTGTA